MNEKAPMTERERLAERIKTVPSYAARDLGRFERVDGIPATPDKRLFVVAEESRDLIVAALHTPAPALNEEERRLREFLSNHAATFAKTPKPDHVTVALSECELGAILSRLAAPAVAGWKLVPVEPTKEMLRAASNAAFGWPRDFARNYRAMLAASPPAQAESQEVNLKPGWLKRDMERASARIEEWKGKGKAESREDIRNAALEEAAKLIEKDFGVQHPLKPLGVSMNFLPGCASRATAIRALKSESRARQGSEP